jgi:hypothetical protein
MIPMTKRALVSLLVASALCVSHHAVAGYSPFSCQLLETQTFLPQLSTFSGYRWIECRVVGAEVADIENILINNGECQTFDNWFAGRRFIAGEAVYIPYACMSPVKLAILANGVITKIRLR